MDICLGLPVFARAGGMDVPSSGGPASVEPETAMSIAAQLVDQGDTQAALDTLSVGGLTATLSGDLDALEQMLEEMERLGGS